MWGFGCEAPAPLLHWRRPRHYLMMLDKDDSWVSEGGEAAEEGGGRWTEMMGLGEEGWAR